jgi:hypothetical protein
MHRSTRWLLVTLVLWTVFVWGNRLSNAWSSTTESTSAKVGSSVLAAVFLAFAVATAWIVRRTRTAPLDRLPGAASSTMALVLQAFAIWTTGVWLVRVGAMAVADHSVGFKVVHAMLGVVSIALVIPAWREGSRARRSIDERQLSNEMTAG